MDCSRQVLEDKGDEEGPGTDAAPPPPKIGENLSSKTDLHIQAITGVIGTLAQHIEALEERLNESLKKQNADVSRLESMILNVAHNVQGPPQKQVGSGNGRLPTPLSSRPSSRHSSRPSSRHSSRPTSGRPMSGARSRSSSRPQSASNPISATDSRPFGTSIGQPTHGITDRLQDLCKDEDIGNGEIEQANAGQDIAFEDVPPVPVASIQGRSREEMPLTARLLARDRWHWAYRQVKMQRIFTKFSIVEMKVVDPSQTINGRLQNVESHFGELHSAISKMKDHVTASCEAQARSQAKLIKTLQADVQKLKSTVEQVDSAGQRAQAELVEVRDSCTRCESRSDQHAQRMDELAQCNDQNAEHLGQHGERLVRHEELLGRHEELLGKHDESLKTLSNSVSQCQKESLDARERLESMDGSLKALAIATKVEGPQLTVLLEATRKQVDALGTAMAEDKTAQGNSQFSQLQLALRAEAKRIVSSNENMDHDQSAAALSSIISSIRTFKEAGVSVDKATENSMDETNDKAKEVLDMCAFPSSLRITSDHHRSMLESLSQSMSDLRDKLDGAILDRIIAACAELKRELELHHAASADDQARRLEALSHDFSEALRGFQEVRQQVSAKAGSYEVAQTLDKFWAQMQSLADNMIPKTGFERAMSKKIDRDEAQSLFRKMNKADQGEGVDIGKPFFAVYRCEDHFKSQHLGTRAYDENSVTKPLTLQASASGPLPDIRSRPATVGEASPTRRVGALDAAEDKLTNRFSKPRAMKTASVRIRTSAGGGPTASGGGNLRREALKQRRSGAAW